MNSIDVDFIYFEVDRSLEARFASDIKLALSTNCKDSPLGCLYESSSNTMLSYIKNIVGYNVIYFEQKNFLEQRYALNPKRVIKHLRNYGFYVREILKRKFGKLFRRIKFFLSREAEENLNVKYVNNFMN